MPRLISRQIVLRECQRVLKSIEDHRDWAVLQQLVMNYCPNGTEMDTVLKIIQKNYLGIRNACFYDYSNGMDR